MKKLILLALVACGSSKKQPPPDPAPLLSAIHDFAERACQCDTDKQCIQAVRDEYDTQKEWLLGNGARLAGDDRAKFDADLQRLKMCGDAAGLTFWDH
jgi:hypothetical protein